MEPKFRVKCEVTWDCYLALCKAQRSKWPRIAVLLICAAAECYYGAKLVMGGNSTVLGWLAILLGALILTYCIFFDKIMSWLSWRRRNPAVHAFEYSFDEEGFEVNNSIGASQAQYAGLMKMVETNGYFLLYMGKTAAHILPKVAFVEGKPEDFVAFLEEKTGKKFTRARSF